MKPKCIVCHTTLAEGLDFTGAFIGVYYCPMDGCMRYGLVTMVGDHDKTPYTVADSMAGVCPSCRQTGTCGVECASRSEAKP